jgi:hypothetical protein
MIDVFHEELKINLTEKISTAKKKIPTNGNTLKNVTVEHIFYFISKNVISPKGHFSVGTVL